MIEQTSEFPRGLKEFEEDSKWFYDNISLLRKRKFKDKFVAIKNKEVIAFSNNLNVVVSSVEKKGENPAYIVIEFVYPEETIILL